MANNNTFSVEVSVAETVLSRFTSRNKKNRPIMEPLDSGFKKGSQFVVSAMHTESSADKGDGIIHADGGNKYYFIPTVSPDVHSVGLFINVDDVKKTSQDVEHYTVKAHDTLEKIAKQVYENGDRTHYMAIYNANRHILNDPDVIHPGQVLIIPKM